MITWEKLEGPRKNLSPENIFQESEGKKGRIFFPSPRCHLAIRLSAGNSFPPKVIYCFWFSWKWVENVEENACERNQETFITLF